MLALMELLCPSNRSLWMFSFHCEEKVYLVMRLVPPSQQDQGGAKKTTICHKQAGGTVGWGVAVRWGWRWGERRLGSSGMCVSVLALKAATEWGSGCKVLLHLFFINICVERALIREGGGEGGVGGWVLDDAMQCIKAVCQLGWSRWGEKERKGRRVGRRCSG